MILWRDAQMPPSPIKRLRQTLAIDTVAVRDIALRDADDRAIFAAAQEGRNLGDGAG